MSIENISVFFCAFLMLNIFVKTNIIILKDALRIVPYFVFTTVGAKHVPLAHSTPQSCPIFAYREAGAPLLCLRSASVGAKRTSTGCSAPCRGGSLSNKTTPVQAHRGFRLLTLALFHYRSVEKEKQVKRGGFYNEYSDCRLYGKKCRF